MKVSIGNVWDSTTDVLAGRAGLLIPVAAAAFLLPDALRATVTSYGGTSPGVAALSAVATLLAAVATVWGSLTVIGVATDPDTTRSAAGESARRRLPAALLVSLVLVAIAIAAVLPLFGALWAGGVDFRTMAAGTGSGGQPTVSPAAVLFCMFYSLVLLVAALWVSARLTVLNPVILYERPGIGAIGRSVALTRGLTLKLIGVILLLGVVWVVAALAAQYVVFIPLRLLLGPNQIATATWLGAVASAAVGAVFSTVAAVFTARLYVALVPAPRLAATFA